MNWITHALLTAVCLTAYAGKGMATEDNLWKGIQAIHVSCVHESIRIAVEAELRRFRIPVVSTESEMTGKIWADLRVYVDERPLTTKNGIPGGTVYLAHAGVLFFATTPQGGRGLAIIYTNATYGFLGPANTSSAVEKGRQSAIEWATEIANSYLKDNP